MTVALYQGNNAEMEWWEYIKRHSCLRHPNFVQIYGTASSSGIHAAVFHDDLIPAKQIFQKHSGSHLATVYLWDQLETEFTNAYYYMKSYSETELDYWGSTMWIRRSTGRLCIELVVPNYDGNPITSGFRIDSESRSLGTSFLFEPPDHSQIIEAISMEHYHAICSIYFAQTDTPEVSPNTLVHLRSVVYMPDGCEIPRQVSCLSDPQFQDLGWRLWDDWDSDEGYQVIESGWILESGWTRVVSSDIRHRMFQREFVAPGNSAWLAQANHIFERAKIPSNYSDYRFIDSVEYQLYLSNEDDIPAGYLFLCPLQDLQGNSPSEFRIPACLAYWSLDPSGTERLGSEEAERLGFPSFTVQIFIETRSWDDAVYAGIRKFHQAKGFDPYSQDVAREFRYPLYKVCGKTDILCRVTTL
ncbi:hypothetical protein C8J57DRAFT_1193621 [Mycena rebaudengoi]|nr:hypothetical protein C8J57DRAFT_1193621 [Mycena rebaudengoi]